MFSRLYSYVHIVRRRAKKSCRNVNTGIRLAFDPVTIDDDAGSTEATICDLPVRQTTGRLPGNQSELLPHSLELWKDLTMTNLCKLFLQDEAGFVVSAELVLVCTITTLSLCVGLSEVAFGINGELEDVGAAFGSLNQSFHCTGMANNKGTSNTGSCFNDMVDQCDGQHDIVTTGGAHEMGNNGW
jgi:hypothetical protein